MPERFAEIGKRLIKQYGSSVLITWGKGEEELAEHITNLIDENSIMAPQTKSIGELAAIIQNLRLKIYLNHL